VYRSIGEQPDIETGRKIARALLTVLGIGPAVAGPAAVAPAAAGPAGSGSPGALQVIEDDLRSAIEDDDPVQVLGAATVLGESAHGESAPLDDSGLADVIGYIAVSEVAAQGVLVIFERAGRFSQVHFDELVRVVRAGLPPDHREEAARRLFGLHVAIHRDPLPYLPLLEDESPFLRMVAVEALAEIDAEGYAGMILEVAEARGEPERSAILFRLSSAIPADGAATLLRELESRWPEPRSAAPWVDIGLRDGEVLLRTFRAETDPRIRRRILIGWRSESMEPVAAVRFVLETLDTDADPAVRAQALIALGATDHPRARERLAEEAKKEGDHTREAHLAGGILNALAAAPDPWVYQVAIPFARRRIANASEPEVERRRWEETLRRTHPDAVGALAP